LEEQEKKADQPEIEHLADFRQEYPRTTVWEWAKVTPIFAAMSLDDRKLARFAAPLYAKETASGKPSPMRPDRWLRSRMFDNFKGYEARPSGTQGLPVETHAGQAVIAFHGVARVSPLVSRSGTIYWPCDLTPQVLAFAAADKPTSWPWWEGGANIRAWNEFLEKHVKVPRPPLVIERGGKRGFFAPWPFPPSLEGKVYSADSTGPPNTLMTEEDEETDFR
jgi:hypothetical protein